MRKQIQIKEIKGPNQREEIKEILKQIKSKTKASCGTKKKCLKTKYY